jgi:hypothetical protein
MTGLGLLADVAADTRKIVEILEELGEEETTKAEREAQLERIREARELIERERRIMREQREADERKKAG